MKHIWEIRIAFPGRVVCLLAWLMVAGAPVGAQPDRVAVRPPGNAGSGASLLDKRPELRDHSASGYHLRERFRRVEGAAAGLSAETVRRVYSRARNRVKRKTELSEVPVRRRPPVRRASVKPPLKPPTVVTAPVFDPAAGKKLPGDAPQIRTGVIQGASVVLPSP
ncbi:MAG: hypothetical protein SFU56_17995 [Capsulimonadales bacterium]|nr:hypothetical protein [Capsulimonadales bacterium]